MMGKRSPKGTVSVQAVRGNLRLRWRVNGEPYSLALGYPDQPAYRRVAEIKAKVIEADVLYNRFDPTLEKYRSTIDSKAEPEQKPASLREIWAAYVEFKRPQCKVSTMRSQYKNWSRYVTKFPTDDPMAAPQIRDWILATIPIDSSKRLLVALNACANWAVDSGLLERNAFLGMASKIKVPKPQQTDDDIDPFTAEERDLIIASFEKNRYYKHYAPLVKFLFKTGCRPGEALALQWQHISKDCDTIMFRQVLSHTEDGRRIAEGLKTQERRNFPCNSTLQALLREIKKNAVKPGAEGLLFPGPRGAFVDLDNFGDRGWAKILADAKIRYRRVYQARHTFITLALEAGMDVQDVAKLVGNSPRMIYDRYAAAKRSLEVPDF